MTHSNSSSIDTATHIAALLLGVALLLVARRGIAVGDHDAVDDCSQVIYVARRGWHIDVGFAVESLTPPLERVAREFPDVRYVFFGFGDRRYLMASHHALPAMLRALWPGAGVILVTGLGAPPGAAFGAEHVIEVRVTEAQSMAAQIYVAGSMAISASDGLELPTLGMGPYPGSLYLAASRDYSALHTCNTWAAEILKAAGLPIHSGGLLFAGQVWKRAAKIAAAQAASRRSNSTASCRGASTRSGTPPRSLNLAGPRPLFSPAAADCCC